MSGSFYTQAFPLYAHRRPSVRRLVAGALRSASVALARLSRSLAAVERARERTPAETVLEFYAEAGAPEGALYVDGHLIGFLPGVKRL
jgi:hypothetical protein